MSRHHAGMSSRRWEATRRAAFERDGWKCRLCDKAGRLEAHHRLALNKGGKQFDLANILTLCRSCHIAQDTAQRRPPVAGQADWRAAAARAFD